MSFENPDTTVSMEFTYETTGSSMTSSSSHDVGFYLECAVLVIGVVGTAANALVLYAMVVSKQHKKQMLIFNQNLLDFVGCFFLAIVHAAKLGNINLNGTRGYWLCLIVFSEGSSWGPFVGSLINLATVTIERYLKVVHHVWAQKNLHDWMKYVAGVFAWVGGTVIAAAVTTNTTAVVRGSCYSRVFWKSQVAQMAYWIWYILSFYVIMLLIFIFCYARILMAVRRQARVMAAHNAAERAGPSSGENQLKQIQTSVIKTMLLVSLLFAITWAPGNVFAFLNNVAEVRLSKNAFYVVIFIGYLYLCINPFIYATKFEPVKHVLVRFIPCNKATQPLESVEMN